MTELTVSQYAALEALLEGKTQQEAAAQANVDVRTLRRWLAQPEFLNILHEARVSLWLEVTGRIQAAGVRAVDTLLDVMVNANSAALKIRAARTLLELGARALSFEALNVEALCAQATQLQAQPTEHQPENRTKPDIAGPVPPQTTTEPDISGQKRTCVVYQTMPSGQFPAGFSRPSP